MQHEDPSDCSKSRTFIQLFLSGGIGYGLSHSAFRLRLSTKVRTCMLYENPAPATPTNARKSLYIIKGPSSEVE